MAELNAELRIIQGLLRGGLTAAPFTIGTDAVDWQWVQKCLEEHQIMPIAWMGCKHVQDAKHLPQTFCKALEHEYQMSAGWDTCQYFALEEIRQALRTAKIDFMPLKGSVLKLDYPHSLMRNMSDLDILFRAEQFDRVRPILEKAGCRFAYRGAVDESYLMGPVVHIEAHWALLEEKSPQAAFFNAIWERALPAADNTSEYKMTWEDYYLYMIAHAAKHFLMCGTGLRNLADMYVFLQKHDAELNHETVNKQLQVLQLDRFEQMLKDLTAAWFEENKSLTPEQQKVLCYMIQSGVYGTWETNQCNQAVAHAGEPRSKWRVLWNVIFPSRESMCEKFPVLKEKPFLLLPAWLLYLARQILHLPRSICRMQKLFSIKEEMIGEQKELLHWAGLDHSA